MFKKARLKLTAWYLTIIMLISLSFSIVIYRVLVNEFDRFSRRQHERMERRFREQIFQPPNTFRSLPAVPYFEPELVEETKKRLILYLALINLGIFFITGTLGYFLAEKTLQPIQDMVNEQNQFISDASHELRTPLTSLKTSIEVFLRNKNCHLAEAKTTLKENLSDVERLETLTNQLLQLAQHQTFNDQYKFRPVPVVLLIANVEKKLKPLINKKNLTINKQVENLYILGDQKSLENLLIILLDNAIKYSGKNKEIVIKVEKKDRMIKLSIKDQGIGIDKKDLPHIFDRFYRADSARTKEDTGGYGLGLSIAKKIVDNHHGSIKIKSQLNQGTIVEVFLPIKQSKRDQKVFR